MLVTRTCFERLLSPFVRLLVLGLVGYILKVSSCGKYNINDIIMMSGKQIFSMTRGQS